MAKNLIGSTCSIPTGLYHHEASDQFPQTGGSSPMRHRILFEISHPKHFYQFAPLAKELLKDNDVLFIARDKDVSIELISQANLPYAQFGRHGKTIQQKLFFTPLIMRDYLKVLMRFRPELIISRSSPYAVIAGPLLKAKSVIMPDSEVVPLINQFVAPMADFIITPLNFARNFGHKHHRINGLFEESYLHPDHFQPNGEIRRTLGVSESDRYVILRFVAWHANHDVKNYGFSNRQKEQLVDLLLDYGRVFISSEGALPEKLASLRLRTPANEIHSVLHYASLYIGDSQTMATESALLGTPSIRFNSFVGENDMSNFKLLEQQYGLLRNCQSFEDVLIAAKEMLIQDAKAQWIKKQQHYFSTRGDLNKDTVVILKRFLGEQH